MGTGYAAGLWSDRRRQLGTHVTARISLNSRGSFAQVSGVLAREQFAIMAAGDDALGVGGMDREAPDWRIGLDGQRQHLPAFAAVAGALDAAGVAGRDKQ